MRRNVELELGVPGKSLWMRKYWDRYIRNEEHLHTVIEYIHQKPVKLKLVHPWRL
jgi:putative transposase